MRDFTLVSYKMIRVNFDQFDKHFCFFYYLFVIKNRLEWSFLRCTQVLKIECALECPPGRENLFHTSPQRESKQLSPAKKSRRDHTFFISHLCIHKINDNVEWLAAFLKNCLDIINHSPSKQNICKYLLLIRNYYIFSLHACKWRWPSLQLTVT